MTNFIPLFPLAVVVYPGQELNLHIFEPRYKQLINDCFTAKKPFGIPTVIDDKVSEYGTLVEITAITKTYDNGEMDIKTKGTLVFKMLEKIEALPNKLYHGAIVTYPATKYIGSIALLEKIVGLMEKMHAILNIPTNHTKPTSQLLSFDIAPQIGLSLQDKYQLLHYESELHRLQYLFNIIKNTLPILQEMNNMVNKQKNQQDFENLRGFDFSKN